jgi:AraC-like DNA-binding protein
MPTATRPPAPWLRPFVRLLWVSDQPAAPDGAPRERVLPTGVAHVVLRLSDAPLRVFEGEGDAVGRALGPALVGGPRAEPYVRDVSVAIRSVGAELQPGAVPLLLGVPADELAGRHTPLDALWPGVESLRERLAAAGGADRMLDLFEAALSARLPALRGLHPAVATALAHLDTSAGVGAAVAATGYSHRRLIELFRREVGLAPKLYGRVRRFQAALLRALRPGAAWADVAQDAGYADQSHLSREFRAHAGLAPRAYRALDPASPNHVPIRGGSIPFKTPGGRDWQDGGRRRRSP